MAQARDYSAFFTSLIVHAVILTAMGMVHHHLTDNQPEVAIETIFDDERDQAEFEQVLETNLTVSENLSVTSGGMVSTNVGASTAPAISSQKIETSESLKEPEIKINAGEITAPGDDILGKDLGVGEVTGEVGAVVDGYGTAMSRISKELIRIMREEKIMVVWLFDESGSMKDDQKEIRDNFNKIYSELGIAAKQESKTRARDQTLLTTILSYGAGVHVHTPKPTTDLKEVQDAITKIQEDETGKENMCQTVSATIDKYAIMARKQDRRLCIVVVTDESGDDGAAVEEVITRAKRSKSPIYILGRESVFGYPYARQIWRDKKYNLPFWIQINRGPETAFPESLQYDGLHGRWDAFSAGFGPYEQVRIARETGGIFFVLPGKEATLAGAGSADKRQFRFQDMKEYQPLLLSRRDYDASRSASKFRTAIWKVIVTLNPHLDKQLNVRELYYPIKKKEFYDIGSKEVPKAIRAMGLLQKSVDILESIKPLRAQEKSPRWRAAYDLTLAQCLAYRVRLFQFCLAMDNHAKNMPPLKKKTNNVWHVRRVPKMLPPDEQQVKLTKVSVKHLDEQLKKAEVQYKFVMKEHPGTPWAQRAGYEMRQGFGMTFVDDYRSPLYDQKRKEIKVPKF
ncbi:vWA domain-containing protein [uncultured Gimesia sp.]|uniref:vWA domain-containing protein n=1 Tax=uncultured Gimesia sp. TaxID=1678688 RepID=UPI002635CCC0|nr:vWA domain-containing protein [uncultured Gimesia sp.]